MSARRPRPPSARHGLQRLIDVVTRPTGVIAAIVVLVGLALGIFDLSARISSALGGDLDKSKSQIAVTSEYIHSGKPWLATTYVLAPYGAALPTIDSSVGCGSYESELARKWLPLTVFDRISFENEGTTARTSIEIRDIRAEVVSKRPPSVGVVVECDNSQGANSVQATVRAEEGDFVVTPNTPSSNPKAGNPIAFSLVAGEREVVDVNIMPTVQDVTINLRADIVDHGKVSTMTLNQKPIVVHSLGGAAPWSYGWSNDRWYCSGLKMPNNFIDSSPPSQIERTCGAGIIYSESALAPTMANAFEGSWIGKSRSLTVDAKGDGLEILRDSCCGSVVENFTLQRVSGTDPISATAVGVITDVSADSNLGEAGAKVGDRIELRRSDIVIEDVSNKTKFCPSYETSPCGI